MDMLGMHSGLLMMLLGVTWGWVRTGCIRFAYDALGFEMGLGTHGKHSLRL